MPHKTLNLREGLLNALKCQNIDKARLYADLLIKNENNSKPYGFVNKAFEESNEALAALYPLRVALLSSFSIDFIHSSLKCYGYINGFNLEIYQAGYSQYRQEILNSSSGLYSFDPNVVILAVEGKHLSPALYEHYLDISADKIEQIAEQVSDELLGLIERYRKNSSATLLIHDFTRPPQFALGIADNNVVCGQLQMIDQINLALRQFAKQNMGVYVVNYAGLINRYGFEKWYDLRMELYAQAPIAQAMFPYLICEYMKYFRSITGKTKKCLVVDLDNTLWGGVVGEDGVQGIKLGQQYPGNAYVAFQHQILNLYKRGIILAIASKNNRLDAEEVFETNPNMALKKQHFSCLEINWNPKSQSIINIAKQLNIGVEHIVFIDDNPAECEQVREALPQVTVILLGKQPESYVDSLLSEGWFDSVNFSVEDSIRNQHYQQRQESQALLENSTSLEAFYHNLDMTLIFDKVNKQSKTRAAQLTQKTNQFNLTTRRYTELEIARRMDDPNWFLISLQVTDRYGDNGIVGLLMVEKLKESLVIDTFLLSCRVIGRTIETAMLVFVTTLAKQLKLDTVIGEMIPTAKNLPVRELYKNHGFLPIPEENDRWLLYTETSVMKYPEWFKLVNNYQG